MFNQLKWEDLTVKSLSNVQFNVKLSFIQTFAQFKLKSNSFIEMFNQDQV